MNSGLAPVPPAPSSLRGVNYSWASLSESIDPEQVHGPVPHETLRGDLISTARNQFTIQTEQKQARV